MACAQPHSNGLRFAVTSLIKIGLIYDAATDNTRAFKPGGRIPIR